MEKLRVYTELRPFSNSVALFFYTDNANGTISIISDVVMTTEERSVAPQTPIEIPRAAAQELMDNLWQCGLRPSEGAGSAGALKATEAHLEDMRKFAGRLLDMVEATAERRDDGNKTD